MSGANLQMEVHVDMPPQSVKDLQELEASDLSSPSCSPSWPLARRPPSNHPNMKHCLEIHVTLIEELRGSASALSFLDSPPHGRYAA